MIEEVIVHVGMHKTGSSSIQSAYSGADTTDAAYLSLTATNHSGFLSTILADDPRRVPKYIKTGHTESDILQRKKQYKAKLALRLAEASENHNKIILSAEALSGSSLIGREGLEYFKRTLEEYCRKIRIIGYVRTPISFMQSAFQQRLKAGARGLDAQALYPRYRARFEKFDRVFGAGNVDLIPFDPGALYGGDVVEDFGRRIGVEVERRKVIRSNQSLSLEATALLFVARHFNPVGRYKGFARDERARIRFLSEIGKEKLVFAPSLVAPVLDKNRDDLDWMTQRLGWPIEDAPRTSDRGIASEADLFEVAVEQKDALWQLIKCSSEVPPGIAGVAELVDRLHAVTAQGPRVPARANPSSWLSGFEKVDLTDATLPPARLLRLIANALAEAEPDVAASLRVAAGKVEGDQPVARLRGAQQEAPRP